MTIELMPLWELVLDGIQVFLCAIILLFLIRNRIKHKRLILNTSPNDYAAEFSSEIRIQHLQQATEHTFDTIVDAIQQERLALRKYYDPQMHGREIETSAVAPPIGINTAPSTDEKHDVDASDFGEILSLSEKGLSTREISQRVNMPRGEVELVLRLNKEAFKDKRRSNINARV
jgi:hypothetical protein